MNPLGPACQGIACATYVFWRSLGHCRSSKSSEKRLGTDDSKVSEAKRVWVTLGDGKLDCIAYTSAYLAYTLSPQGLRSPPNGPPTPNEAVGTPTQRPGKRPSGDGRTPSGFRGANSAGACRQRPAAHSPASRPRSGYSHPRGWPNVHFGHWAWYLSVLHIIRKQHVSRTSRSDYKFKVSQAKSPSLGVQEYENQQKENTYRI